MRGHRARRVPPHPCPTRRCSCLLLEVYRGRDTVVKCAPGIDCDSVAGLGFAGEIEITSAGGSVREACLWSAGLAEAGVRRRATVLDTGENITDADRKSTRLNSSD